MSLADVIVEWPEGRNSAVGVFLHLSKAFNCVDQATPFDRLESHGIGGTQQNMTKVLPTNPTADIDVPLKYGLNMGCIDRTSLLRLMTVGICGPSYVLKAVASLNRKGSVTKTSYNFSVTRRRIYFHSLTPNNEFLCRVYSVGYGPGSRYPVSVMNVTNLIKVSNNHSEPSFSLHLPTTTLLPSSCIDCFAASRRYFERVFLLIAYPCELCFNNFLSALDTLVIKLCATLLQKLGTAHSEELPYFFGSPLVDGFSHFPKNYTKTEVALSESAIIYLSNFVRSGSVLSYCSVGNPQNIIDSVL
ncbi:neurexin protein binding [Homalodisca vitripennis]|nr:neurexin protein binding [Homalodisca vitripennis]